MPLILGFVELLGGVLLLTSGITTASFAQIVKGQARDVLDANQPQIPSSSTTPATAAQVNQATGADTPAPGGPLPTPATGTLNAGNIANAPGNELSSVINPIRAKGLAVERIDQGQDFADTGGTIVSPTAGTVVAEGAVGSGWEGGGYLVERLSSGAYLYFEEGIAPVKNLVGRGVTQGETIAELIPGFHSGVEAGIAAPTSDPGANYIGGGYTTEAQATTGYTEGQVTPAGRTFAAWLKGLGF